MRLVCLSSFLVLAFFTLSTQAAPVRAASAPATPSFDTGLDAERWKAPLPRVAWEEVLEELRLEFFDSATSQTYTAHGPYELIREEDDQVEVRASTASGAEAPRVTLIQTASGLWAVARFADIEFATRIK